MVGHHPDHIIVIGAGASGLMAARELGHAGRRVTILEARDRFGGRIYPLPTAQFGYPAEAGAEFVHAEAPVTRSLLREAKLSLLPIKGTSRNSGGNAPDSHERQLHQALNELRTDVTVTEFLNQYFAGPEYDRLRQSIERMVEGYDAADPSGASTLALREEWMNGGRGEQARIDGGYDALIGFLVAECKRQGTRIKLGAEVKAIEAADGQILVRFAESDTLPCDTVIVTVPLPLLKEIALPSDVRKKVAAGAQIGFGNVVKLLLLFESRWWVDGSDRHPSDLTFLLSEAGIPVWWTQHPSERPVLTGWLGGPRTQTVAHLTEDRLIEMGLASLADVFVISPNELKRMLVHATAMNWGNDRFARGAYSYATPETREAQSVLSGRDGSAVLFSGEALYRGPAMGTVEAALASGLETARTILTA